MDEMLSAVADVNNELTEKSASGFRYPGICDNGDEYSLRFFTIYSFLKS